MKKIWLAQSEAIARLIVWIAVLILGCSTFFQSLSMLEGWHRWFLWALFILFIIAVPIVFNSELRHLRSLNTNNLEKKNGTPHNRKQLRQQGKTKDNKYGFWRRLQERIELTWLMVATILLLAVILFRYPLTFDRIAVLALIAITAAYANSAYQQVKASRKMVEEVKEQRLAASHPLVIPKAVNRLNEEDIETEPFTHFLLLNAGNGTAIGLEISITDENKSSFSEGHYVTFMKSGEEIKYHPRMTELKKGAYNLFCQYTSISNITGEKRFNQTWLPFRIVKKVHDENGISIVTFNPYFKFDIPKDDVVPTYIFIEA